MKTESKESNAVRAEGTDTNKEQFYKVTLVWKREREGSLTVWADSPADAMQKASLLAWFPVPLVEWENVKDGMSAKSAEPVADEKAKGAANE
jgi:hypothetical protein